MRLIGEIENGHDAEKFAAFLLVQGVESRAEPLGSGAWEIWVKDEDQFQTALQELKQFQQDPENTKYVQAVEQANTIHREQEKKRQQMQRRIVNVRAGGMKRRNQWTIILIVISGIVTLATNFGEDMNSSVFRAFEFVSLSPDEGNALWNQVGKDIDSLQLRLANLRKGEIWRVITPIFIHHSGNASFV